MLKAMREKAIIDVGNDINMRVIADKVPGSTAVVIVHGLTSYVHEALYEDARRFFNKKGFSVFRPELYGWEIDARDLKDCTLETHGSDLDRLIVYLRKNGYKSVYIVGHSYGWPSIQSMEQSPDRIAVWDGTFVGMPLSFIGSMGYVDKLGVYIDSSGSGLIIGKAMFVEAKILNSNPESISKVVTAPTKLFYAGEGILHKYSKLQLSLLRKVGVYCRSRIIKNADHNFTDDNVKDKLFKATYNWFSK